MVAGNVLNVKVEPCTAIWGKPQNESLTCVPDVAGSLNNKYFTLEVPEEGGASQKKYYVWIDVNAAGVDPAVAGRTGIHVSVATGASASVVAAAIAAALDALTSYFNPANTGSSGAVLTWEAKHAGPVTQAANGAGGSSPAFTTYTVNTEGFGGDLGLIDGDIEIALDEKETEVTAQQEGTNVLDAIRTGKNVSVSLTLKETSADQLRMLLTRGGGKFTPTSGTEVFGWGGSQDFTSELSSSAKLVLHPVRLAYSDKSADIAFWFAYPKLSALNTSGENPRMVPVEFKIFPDRTKKAKLRLMVMGDHTQDLSVDAAGT